MTAVQITFAMAGCCPVQCDRQLQADELRESNFGFGSGPAERGAEADDRSPAQSVIVRPRRKKLMTEVRLGGAKRSMAAVQARCLQAAVGPCVKWRVLTCGVGGCHGEARSFAAHCGGESGGPRRCARHLMARRLMGT